MRDLAAKTVENVSDVPDGLGLIMVAEVRLSQQPVQRYRLPIHFRMAFSGSLQNVRRGLVFVRLRFPDELRQLTLRREHPEDVVIGREDHRTDDGENVFNFVLSPEAGLPEELVTDSSVGALILEGSELPVRPREDRRLTGVSAGIDDLSGA